MRSKIIHGRQYDSEMDAVMSQTELIIRAGLKRILNDPNLLNTFKSKQRDRFLEDVVFSNARSVLTTSDAASLTNQIEQSK
jgi:hypothetical protein